MKAGVSPMDKSSKMTFNQQKQAIEGDQTNIGRDAVTHENNINIKGLKKSSVIINPSNTKLIIAVSGLILIGVVAAFYFMGDGDSIKNEVSGQDNVGAIHTGQGDITIIQAEKVNYPAEISGQTIEIITELGITQSALKSFFKILEKEQVPPEDLDSTLREIAKRYKDLLAKVDTLKSNDESVKLLITQAKQALEAGEFDKAESLFNQAKKTDIEAAKQLQAQVQQVQETANKRLLSAAESTAANGELKITQLAYKEAGEYYQEAAELLPAGNDEKLAEYLNWAGEAFYYAGLYDQAKPLFEKALAIREKILGSEHPDVATSLNNLAGLHKTQGNYEQAKPLYERALAIDEKVLGAEHPNVAGDLNNLALLHQTQGNYEQAKPLYERALAIWEKVLGQEHPSVAIGLNNLAELHRALGNYEQAKPLYEKALAIREKVLDKEHPDVAISLNNLAGLHGALGNYEQAKPLYERALAIWEKVLGQEHPSLATSLNNLAELHRVLGNYEQAKPLYERSLGIREKILGSEHPDVAQSLNNLALLHKTQGNYEQAKPLYERALAIDEKMLGKEHPNVAIRLNNLAYLHESQGNYEQAKPLYERALAIFQKVLGDDHPNTQIILRNYNRLLSKMAKDVPPE